MYSVPPWMRNRLSYASVVATLALVIAMRGGALAAGHYPANYRDAPCF